MRTKFVTVKASDRFADVAERWPSGQERSVVVVRGGQLAGLLTLENLQEFVLIQAAHVEE